MIYLFQKWFIKIYRDVKLILFFYLSIFIFRDSDSTRVIFQRVD
jgi:hypothetical protein